MSRAPCVIVGFFIALAGGMFFYVPVQAATCSFDAELTALDIIQKGDFRDRSDLLAALDLRKKILSGAVTCTINDIDALATNVNILVFTSDETKLSVLRETITKRLETVRAYASTEQLRIKDFGIQGTKDFSKNFLAWRGSTYLPLENKASSLILITKSRLLFTLAEQRFANITASTKGLKLDTNKTISPLLRGANVSLDNAQTSYSGAYALLTDAADADVLPVIKASLNALAMTYQTFFDISGAVKKTLIESKL